MKKLLLFALCGVLVAPSTTVYADELIFAQCDDYINVRTNADINSELVGKIYNYNAATILEEDGDWIKIKSGNVEGWVYKDYFTSDETVERQAAYDVAEVYPEILNVRRSPSEESDIIDIVYDGQEIEVIEQDGDWVEVCLDNGIFGYVNANYVDFHTYYGTAETLEEEANRLNTAWLAYLDSQEVEEEPEIETEEYNYPDPEETYDAVEQISYEESYEDYSQSNENYYIPEEDDEYYEEPSYEDYYEEVDNSEYEEDYSEESSYEEEVVEDDNYYYEEETIVEDYTPIYSSSGSAIVDYALAYVGYPYVWGGTSPSGFDCSGLVQYCSSLAGISTPRTAASQYSGGTQISVSDAVNTPGALLFYHDFGHVAISIGDGTVVHASNSTTGVIISDAYYSTPCGAAKYF
jgi:hypothetical protein